jgi:hypothetical protein
MNRRTLRCLLVVWVLCDLLISCAGFIPLTDLAAAQFTTVTGTVVDPSGLPYALGTISATPVLSGNLSPTLDGSQYIAPTQARGLDRNGHPIGQLGDNTVLLPAATKWNSPVCPATGTIQPRGGKGLVCSSWASPITISGASQDVSTNLNGGSRAFVPYERCSRRAPNAESERIWCW